MMLERTRTRGTEANGVGIHEKARLWVRKRFQIGHGTPWLKPIYLPSRRRRSPRSVFGVHPKTLARWRVKGQDQAAHDGPSGSGHVLYTHAEIAASTVIARGLRENERELPLRSMFTSSD